MTRHTLNHLQGGEHRTTGFREVEHHPVAEPLDHLPPVLLGGPSHKGGQPRRQIRGGLIPPLLGQSRVSGDVEEARPRRTVERTEQTRLLQDAFDVLDETLAPGVFLMPVVDGEEGLLDKGSHPGPEVALSVQHLALGHAPLEEWLLDRGAHTIDRHPSPLPALHPTRPEHVTRRELASGARLEDPELDQPADVVGVDPGPLGDLLPGVPAHDSASIDACLASSAGHCSRGEAHGRRRESVAGCLTMTSRFAHRSVRTTRECAGQSADLARWVFRLWEVPACVPHPTHHGGDGSDHDPAWVVLDLQKDVAVDEAIAGDDVARSAEDGYAVRGSVPDEGVELAVLPAWVHLLGKVGEEVEIEGPAGERGIDDPGVETNDHSSEPLCDDLLGELRSVAVPQRKDAVLADLGESVFAIGADIFKEKVGKRDVVD